MKITINTGLFETQCLAEPEFKRVAFEKLQQRFTINEICFSKYAVVDFKEVDFANILSNDELVSINMNRQEVTEDSIRLNRFLCSNIRWAKGILNEVLENRDSNILSFVTFKYLFKNATLTESRTKILPLFLEMITDIEEYEENYKYFNFNVRIINKIINHRLKYGRKMAQLVPWYVFDEENREINIDYKYFNKKGVCGWCFETLKEPILSLVSGKLIRKCSSIFCSRILDALEKNKKLVEESDKYLYSLPNKNTLLPTEPMVKLKIKIRNCTLDTVVRAVNDVKNSFGYYDANEKTISTVPLGIDASKNLLKTLRDADIAIESVIIKAICNFNEKVKTTLMKSFNGEKSVFFDLSQMKVTYESNTPEEEFEKYSELKNGTLLLKKNINYEEDLLCVA